jgi:predicted TIM-barrel fold metal-dependent hydrolase
MMRAIDMHTHLPGTTMGSCPRPTADILAMLDKAGIDLAAVFTMDGFFLDDVAANDALARAAGESGGRLFPFCTVNPRRPGAVDEVRRCVEKLGFRGLKFHPWLQGFSPVGAEMQAIAAEAARLGVPILFHDGTPCYSTPLQVAYLADRYPDLTVILGHGGLMDLWVEALAALRRYPNCHVCLCGSAPPAIFRHLIEQVGPERVMLGTDAGFGDDYAAEFRMAQFRALPLDDAAREAIFWRNAMRMLKLD